MRFGVVTMILFAACTKPSPPPPGPQLVFGGARPVTISVPRSYAGSPTPLLLVLHGYGSSGMHHEQYLGADALKDAIVVAPDGTEDPEGNRFWNTGSDACCNFRGSSVDDVKYLGDLLTEIGRVYAVDPKRIFVLGHSNGGFMAHRLGCELSGELAAIVSLAGVTPLERCASPMSVLQIHGDRDVGVRIDGGTDIMHKGGGDYPGAVETLERWARADGCKVTRTSGAAIDLESTIPGAETTVSSWDGCAAGTDVTLWTIEGGGHVPTFGPQFPGLVWRWLLAHPRR